MKTHTLSKILVASCTALALSACDVDVKEKGSLPDVSVDAEAGKLPEYEVKKVEEGKMPDVDVSVTGGNLPEVEVETPDVIVESETVEVEVPTDVEVKTKTETVEVPTVDIELPDE